MKTRLTLRHPESLYTHEECAVFELLENGGVAVKVSEEKAIDDNYNQSFTCTFSMTIEQAMQLRDWLISLNKQIP